MGRPPGHHRADRDDRQARGLRRRPRRRGQDRRGADRQGLRALRHAYRRAGDRGPRPAGAAGASPPGTGPTLRPAGTTREAGSTRRASTSPRSRASSASAAGSTTRSAPTTCTPSAPWACASSSSDRIPHADQLVEALKAIAGWEDVTSEEVLADGGTDHQRPPGLQPPGGPQGSLRVPGEDAGRPAQAGRSSRRHHLHASRKSTASTSS